MAMILESGVMCQYGHSCPYNRLNECWGARPDRDNQFKCSYVENGVIREGGYRNPNDKTGQMVILSE